MFKKICGVVTILAFLLFDWACVVHSVAKAPARSVRGENVQILGVVKKSGEYIQFPESNPARVFEDRIVGGSGGKNEISLSDIKEMRQNAQGLVYEITMKDGRILHNIEGEKVDDKIVLGPMGPLAVSIPLSDVEMVWVKRVDFPMTFLATIGILAGTYLAVGLIALAFKKSCPFIYSFDGRGYIFDAEPYGGATSRGLKRTEWCALEHLRPVRGEYRLRITNEVDETQHTDELKLVAVDHPSGVQVVPDETGAFHTFARPQAPLSARDQNGRDIMPFVRADDWIFWESRLDEKDPEKDSDLRDELFFEFPKPAAAKRVKLLFNGCNTLWASNMVQRFLELYGDALKEHYAAIDSRGPAYQAMASWNQKEELYSLQVRAETPAGWTSLGTIIGGGPFVSETRAYVLDLTNIPGDTLRLKLSPPAGFWMINHLAVDYSDDVPVQVTELEPARAVDSGGRDIRGLLARTDDVYYDAPFTGDSADVTFLVPPQQPGSSRSLFCKASGYYDIHLKAAGRPRLDILSRFRSEPGFTVRYALREYQKWRAEHPVPQPVK